MNTGPHLASMERRIAAFAIDALLLLFLGLAIGAAVDEMGASNALTLTIVVTVFVAYHSTSLANPSVGLGRVVAAISVISLRSGPELSRLHRHGPLAARPALLARRRR